MYDYKYSALSSVTTLAYSFYAYSMKSTDVPDSCKHGGILFMVSISKTGSDSIIKWLLFLAYDIF